jgi:hypothetical protein
MSHKISTSLKYEILKSLINFNWALMHLSGRFLHLLLQGKVLQREQGREKGRMIYLGQNWDNTTVSCFYKIGNIQSYVFEKCWRAVYNTPWVYQESY